MVLVQITICQGSLLPKAELAFANCIILLLVILHKLLAIICLKFYTYVYNNFTFGKLSKKRPALLLWRVVSVYWSELARISRILLDKSQYILRVHD